MNCALAVVAADWWIEQMLKRCSELYPNKVTTNGSDFVIVDNSLDEEGNVRVFASIYFSSDRAIKEYAKDIWHLK